MTYSSQAIEEKDAGATWHRLDLHLHSPGAPGFEPPEATKGDDRKGLVDAYVEQLLRQEISVAALTDYNRINIEWFEVTAAKAINRGITLLPGAELTFREGRYSLHVLAIFAGDTDLRVLNHFLRFLDKNPGSPLFDGQGSYRDIRLKSSLTDALKSFRSQFNCLLIFPHPDRTNGLCRSLTAELAAELLTEIGPDAIESMSEKEKKKLQSAGALSEEFWDRMAFVDFSNPKRIEEIGTQYRSNGALRATYLKLSSTRLDALRLAFHDPESRLSLGEIPSSFHPRIRSMTISGTGFLGDLSISWNRDLNVIIGRKGAGKSALLECLRYAFGIPPYSGQSSREELVSRALGPGGKIEVILEKTTKEGEIGKYRIARTWGEEPRTFQVDPEKDLPIKPSELLYPIGGPTILGQREIYTISQSEAHQLALLDELIGEEAHQCTEAVAKAMEALTTNAGAILEMLGKLSKREDYCQRLKKIEDEIEKNKRDIANRPKGAAGSSGAEGCLQIATHRVKSALEDCDNWRLNLLASVDTAHQSLYGAKSNQSAIFQEGAIALAILKEELTVVLEKERALLSQAVQNLKRLDVRSQENLPPSKGEGDRKEPVPPAQSVHQHSALKFEEERGPLLSLVAGFNDLEDRLKALRKERQKLLRQVRESRNIQNRLRTEKADAISKCLNGRLHVQMEYSGQKESFREQLIALLKGSDISQEAIDQLILEATDGMLLADAVRAGSEEVQTRFKLKPEIADRLIQWLTSEESRLLQLESLTPQDAIRLKLNVVGQWRALDHVSAGQSAAAIMIFLLGLEGRILVIDQPDDYLEGPSFQAEIAQILREQKSSKNRVVHHQVILAAKDATLPVMADAELVLPLEVRDDRAYVVGKASIDDRSICEAIKKMMQGGEEALRLRAEKYGGFSL